MLYISIIRTRALLENLVPPVEQTAVILVCSAKPANTVSQTPSNAPNAPRAGHLKRVAQCALTATRANSDKTLLLVETITPAFRAHRGKFRRLERKIVPTVQPGFIKIFRKCHVVSTVCLGDLVA
jgi:hypothetical protein